MGGMVETHPMRLRKRLMEPARRAYSWFLWDYLERRPTWQNWVLFALGKRYPIFLDFPVDPRPRYGHGRPPHAQLYALIDRHRERYADLLRQLVGLKEELARIPVHRTEDNTLGPVWANGMLPGLDAASLYGLLALHVPRRYYEIGSGNSTMFARRAIEQRGLRTEIVSYDPHPREEIDALCDRVVRRPVEEVDPAEFDALEAGDVLFVDNSHRSFMNSDVTAVFLDILPRLAPGVIVGIHDINLPYDYEPASAHRYYSEQYLLAAYLLAEGEHAELLLPCRFISGDEPLRRILEPLWSDPRLRGVDGNGAAFWMRMR